MKNWFDTECQWTLEEICEGTWETSCGQVFLLVEGTPKDNGMQYCCYCGKTLTELIIAS